MHALESSDADIDADVDVGADVDVDAGADVDADVRCMWQTSAGQADNPFSDAEIHVDAAEADAGFASPYNLGMMRRHCATQMLILHHDLDVVQSQEQNQDSMAMAEWGVVQNPQTC